MSFTTYIKINWLPEVGFSQIEIPKRVSGRGGVGGEVIDKTRNIKKNIPEL